MSINPKFDIVILLGQDWRKYHRQSMIKFLARNMIDRGKILCVERPICLLTTPFLHTRKFMDWAAGKKGVRQITDNLFLFTPLVALHDYITSYIPFMVDFNKKVISPKIKKVIQQIDLKGEKRLLWLYDPIQVDYIGIAGEDYVIYECLDSYLEFSSSRIIKKLICQKEELLIKKSDLIFATGEIEYLSKRKLNPNTFYTPNGVDTELFRKATDKSTVIPLDLASISTPRIGYIGAWVNCDTDLLIEIARARPHWSFIIVGSIGTPKKEKKKILKLANIYFLGWKDYELLPGYLKGFDLAIVFFKNNLLIENADPLKTYEYMAGGCPIISTDIPQARRFAELVKVIKNKTEFIAAAEDLLRSDNSHLKNRLVKEAQQHSWEGRIEHILEIIKETLVDSDRKR